MRLLRQLAFCFVAVAAHFAISMEATAATIAATDWVVHNTNGSITVADAATNSPTFTAVDTAADIMSIMAPFPSITLADDGDYIKLTTTLTMTNRSGTGVNTLNTHLRLWAFQWAGRGGLSRAIRQITGSSANTLTPIRVTLRCSRTIQPPSTP